MNMEWLLLLAGLGIVGGIAWLGWQQWSRQQVRRRLDRLVGTPGQSEAHTQDDTPPAQAPWQERLRTGLASMAKLAQSDSSEAWEQSPERQRFWHAGLTHPQAPLIFFAAKTLLSLILPTIIGLILFLGSTPPTLFKGLFAVLSAAYIGYMLPDWVLRSLIERRQRDLFESFPDALDLMTICVEAGLAIDAAIDRVGQEIRMKSEVLSKELRMVTLELRAGSTRERALRNFAARTGLHEIDTLAAMLIQADRFGTSIAVSLRVHAETLRQTRKQRAEEAAAKIPTKLLFPLVFCIFPSLLLVLLGPAFINIYRTLGSLK